MKIRPRILFVDDRRWRLGTIEGDRIEVADIQLADAATVDQQVEQLRSTAAMRGIEPGELVLALPTTWCFSASFDRGTITPNDKTALLYALEEHLPVVAEDMIADFVCHKNHVLAVCATRAKLVPLVAGLQAGGWSILAVTPAPLLALSTWLAPPCVPCDIDMVVAAEGDHWIILTLQEGSVSGWHLVPANPGDLALRVGMLRNQMGQGPLRLLSAGMPPTAEPAAALDLAVVKEAEPPVTLEVAATLAANDIVSGPGRPWVNLRVPGQKWPRTQHLYRPIRFVGVCAVVSLLTWLVTLLVVAWRFDRQTAQLQVEQARLFQQAIPRFPRAIPQQVARYLASEYQRLAKARLAEPARSAGPAFELLSDLFARLPSQVPLQLMRLRIDADRAELTATMLSRDDVTRFAAALGADEVLLVQPPPTSVPRGRTISVTLQLQRRNTAHPGGQP